MFDKYNQFAPTTNSSKAYGARSPKSIKAKFDEIAADIQKFRESLRFIRAADPTGVSEEEIISMAIAKHLGKRDGMSYEARSYPYAEWKQHLAYKVPPVHPKFSNEGSTTGGDLANQHRTSLSSDHTTNDNAEPTRAMESGSAGASDVDSDAPDTFRGPQPTTANDTLIATKQSGDTLRPPGRKSQIRLRRTENLR